MKSLVLIGLLLASLIAVGLAPSATSARQTSNRVPGSPSQMTSIRVNVKALQLACAGMICPTSVGRQRAVRTRTAILKNLSFLRRLTNDINQLPNWQPAYAAGCNFAPGGRTYDITFRFLRSYQWTVTLDRAAFAEMLFTNSGDPNLRFRPTCVSPRTASRLNRALDQALRDFSH